MLKKRLLYDFAYIHQIDNRLCELAELAEKENRSYKRSLTDKKNPILYYYFHYTFERLKVQNKIVESDDKKFCCFNTGLVTTHQEAIYALFTENTNDSADEEWRFIKFCRKGEYELSKFQILPEIATYFDDPSCLVYDHRLELRVNISHIINENRERFPEPYKSMDDYALQIIVQGAIDSVKERIKRNYKVAVPQYHIEQIELLLPICLSNRTKADLALAVQKHEGHYRAATCLTLDMAYSNARQIAKQDREWLDP